MTCPPDVARVILQILRVAMLRIRAGGWGGDSSRCAAEADHVHNLPALLIDYSDELLRFYWRFERRSFMSRSRPEDLEGYETLWTELGESVSANISGRQF